MLQRHGVVPGTGQLRLPVRALILGDGLFAAAGVTGDGVAGYRRVRRQQSPADQRRDQGDEPRGIAPRVGHPLRRSDRIPLLHTQLREAVGPSIRRPVCGGGINNPGAGIIHQLHRLHGGGIRQTKEHQVRLVHQLFSLSGILALLLVDEQELQVLPAGQTVVNLQAGSTLLAVDINYRFIHGDAPQ